jgi:hypothetical protein
MIIQYGLLTTLGNSVHISIANKRLEPTAYRAPSFVPALPDLVGLLYHVNQQLENRLSLKPHLDVVDNDI